MLKFWRLKPLLSWHESNGSGNKDPWSNRGGSGPPDLDEVFSNLKKKFTGGGKAAGGSQGVPEPVFWLLPLLLLLLWLAYGIYQIKEGEVGVVLRFGKYLRMAEPGLHWHIPPPIESLEKVDIGQIRTVEVGYRTNLQAHSTNTIPQESLMLTEDENIIDIKFAVQYRIKSATDYLFNLNQQVMTLHQVTESAIREVVGNSRMEHILTRGRGDVAVQVETLVQAILDRYQAGILVTSVNMQDAQPPEQVQAAFSDAVKAREDEQRQINEAQAYRNDVLPKAKGMAARMVADASAYSAEMEARAQGDAARFLKVLEEYEKAPAVTRERLYLETMEEVYASGRKVIVDSNDSNNLMYLPLDKLINAGKPDAGLQTLSPIQAQEPGDNTSYMPRERNRGRESR